VATGALNQRAQLHLRLEHHELASHQRVAQLFNIEEGPRKRSCADSFFSQEVNLIAWLNRVTEDEKKALVDLLVALELGEKRILAEHARQD
jgi:hypothetical protein